MEPQEFVKQLRGFSRIETVKTPDGKHKIKVRHITIAEVIWQDFLKQLGLK